jgi:hypothetical protein
MPLPSALITNRSAFGFPLSGGLSVLIESIKVRPTLLRHLGTIP